MIFPALVLGPVLIYLVSAEWRRMENMTILWDQWVSRMKHYKEQKEKGKEEPNNKEQMKKECEESQSRK